MYTMVLLGLLSQPVYLVNFNELLIKEVKMTECVRNYPGPVIGGRNLQGEKVCQ